jgi:WhiB family redox-sensing transcriptional regulator
VDTEIFFPPRDKALYKPIADKAKAICWGKDGKPPCPVREDCLREAIQNDELHGIFGGMSHRERNALVRKYTRAGKTLEDVLGE